MGNNAAYDITSEIDPVETLDEVQAKLEDRRREREQKVNAEETTNDSKLQERPESDEEQKKAEAKKRSAEAAKRKREEQERRREERHQEICQSRWVTAGHKVREKRVEHLERVYYGLKAKGEFSGTKQEFFDEGLAMLEAKYEAPYLPSVSPERTSRST